MNLNESLYVNFTNSNNTTNNFTGNNTRRPPFRNGPIPEEITTGHIVSAVFLSILILLIVMGNSLVIASFRVNRRLRTKTNYFIMSLAFADLLIGLVAVPTWIYIYLSPGKYTKTEYEFWITFDVIVGVSSIMNLTMISIERGYALIRPMQHRNISKVVILIAIAVAWLLGLLAASLRFLLPIQLARESYGIIVTIPFFVVPLTIILVTYAIIFKIASAHARGRGVRSFRKDLRIATTVAVVIGFFSVAWTPFFSLNLFFSVCHHYGIAVCLSVPRNITAYIKWMQYGNSAFNPIIYGFRNKDFKITFKKIIFKMCGKEAAESPHTRSTYVQTARKRFVRSESSFDESQLVLYPDQIVPPGMYDMRESYRCAIVRGRKTPKKIKPPKKTLAQGLMTLSVDTFHMAENTDATVVSNSVSTSDLNCNTADPGSTQSPSDDIYPYQNKGIPSDDGVVNTSFMEENIKEDKASRPVSRVRFEDTNGVANSGIVDDDNE